MTQVVIIGCGIVGAAIAYELSQVPGLQVAVLDRQLPAQAATKAALGVLMGVISHKTKGRAWQLRQASIQRYETLIPELEALTGHHIPFNRQGILMLCVAAELGSWEKLVATRASHGLALEIWDGAKVKSYCPQINCNSSTWAIYSPQDRQVDPVSLTLALVEGAKRNGVKFYFGTQIEESNFSSSYAKGGLPDDRRIRQITISGERSHLNVDWLVVSAGLGSLPSLPTETSPPLKFDIVPVLGQAIHLKLDRPLGNTDFQPVITGNDVHIVPLNGGQQATEYWVGATVEFPAIGREIEAAPALLEEVMQQAIAFCPALATANIIKTWSGLRPRPEGRSAPIIDYLSGFSNILLATGHYRNGVLLAPATAQAIRKMILSSDEEW
ncbi:FAD-binding oxidoreductase [Chroococcidiopsis sp. CCNUC1]|uniref:NAD(P)/FAD-dependent oxidoreductase n=1 Tax=Chroococcidiopsis sp. CCNUC1 TaxID=2653189 RepID=UPI00202003C2|nr:FAD-dependent oxidoreductase [Chroococcidiopsis sp. CCNUC1]URD49900.1 FAD-binding oxidoreductase [Chroococcidiopsis sp. CCNUC1]